MIRHAVDRLAPEVDLIQPVGDAAAIGAALDGVAFLPVVPGGATRQDSVRAGLEALAPHAPEVVLVHDAARPYVPAGTVAALLAALEQVPGAIPAVPVADTLKRGGATGTLPKRCRAPGCTGPRPLRLSASRCCSTCTAPRRPAPPTTPPSWRRPATRLRWCPGDEDNIKLTYKEDLVRLERVLAGTLIPRVGTGYDVHALTEGRKLILCGIEVPHDRGLAGHSDADVGIHALCDAIYGALAEGDIGRHFPPSEANWKDADSARFLRHAAGRIAARGGALANADVTLICERPKITPHAPAMIARLADILGVASGRISVKATTTEKLGFTGRMEGIAAQAVVTLLVPG